MQAIKSEEDYEQLAKLVGYDSRAEALELMAAPQDPDLLTVNIFDKNNEVETGRFARKMSLRSFKLGKNLQETSETGVPHPHDDPSFFGVQYHPEPNFPLQKTMTFGDPTANNIAKAPMQQSNECS